MTATPIPTNPPSHPPKSGEIYHVTEKASPQFKPNDIWVRIIRIHEWVTVADGWVWIEVFQLNPNDLMEATERRSIFVQLDGLEKHTP